MNELSEMYGWFHIIEEIADRDVTKFERIIQTPASTIFAHISYMLDYSTFIKRQNKV